MSLDIVIPVFRPDKRLEKCIERLMHQTICPDHIYLVVTYETESDRMKPDMKIYEKYPEIEIRYLPAEMYDHGGTRDRWMHRLDAEIVIFMVQDAIPVDRYLLENLLRPFEDSRVAVTYGRHVTDDRCEVTERCNRAFNYPKKSRVKSVNDEKKLGIKTYFNSNVCAAYRRNYYLQTEGFGTRAISSEDMMAARRLMEKGWKTAYVADARVLHYHNYRMAELWRRNFDIGVAHAEHPEMVKDVPPSGEGLKLVRSTAAWLYRHDKKWKLISFGLRSAGRYVAYQMGRHYKQLPLCVVRHCSRSKVYWKEEERK